MLRLERVVFFLSFFFSLCLFFFCFFVHHDDTEGVVKWWEKILVSVLYHSGSDRAASMATALMTLHVAPHTEGLPTAGVCAAERLLAGVAVRVDAQTGRAREGLVAGAADVAIMVLLVGSRAGRGEIVVVLPGRGDGGDHLRMSGGRRGRGGYAACVLECVRGGVSLVVGGVGGCGGLNGGRVGGHAGSRGSIWSSRGMLDRSLA